MRNLEKLFLAMLITCLLACSNETSEDGAPLILPDDAGVVESDMQTVERPSGCRENENLSRLIPVLSGGKTHPTGRGEHDAVFEHCNRRVVLFGGNDFQPEECADFGPKRFSNETWVYALEYENWVRVTTEGGPSPRGRHEMVFDAKRKRVLLFGGRYRDEGASSFANYDLYNDLWAFNVNTDRWVELETTGDGPSPRTNSAMVYDSVNDQLIVFGGSIARTGTEFLPLADTYILDLEYLVWRRLDADGPVPRLFHRLIFLEGKNQVLMYGGGGRNAFTGPFINDVWVLDLESQTWNLVWRPGDSRGPFARINPALIYDAEAEQVFMFAGHDDTAVGHRNDVWTFDLNTNLWTEIVPGDTGAGEGCSRFCSCEPDFVNVDIASPERRQYHTFTHIAGTRDIILFGGKGDCGYLDDTWRFDLNALSWEELDPAGQGEACMRTGQEGCTDLCY